MTSNVPPMAKAHSSTRSVSGQNPYSLRSAELLDVAFWAHCFLHTDLFDEINYRSERQAVCHGFLWRSQTLCPWEAL